MSKESELLEKISFRENFGNIKQVVKLIHSFDHSFYLWNVMSVIIKAFITYGAMLLSSYIISGLTAGTNYDQLLRITLLSTVLLSIGKSVEYRINKHLDVLYELLNTKYDAIRQEKMMHMDFSLLDSPKLKEITDRIERDRNWGAGILSMFWQGKAFLEVSVNLLVALALLLPMLSYFSKGGQMETIGILCFMIFVLVAGLQIIRHMNQIMYYCMFHIPTNEEKKRLLDYTWSFTHNYFSYSNGKDVRIYQAFDLMKAYSYDKQQTKEYQDHYSRKPAKAAAGSSAATQSISTMITIGSYLIAVIIAKKGGMPVGTVILFAGCLSNLLTGIGFVTINCQEIALTARKQVGILKLLGISDEMYKGSLPMEKRSDGDYQIEFKDVSFCYPGSEQYALRHFSMKLKVGEKLAIVGRNGSGKTTMIKLLCRLYDPDEGEILVNGVNIKKFRYDEYVAIFSVIFQDYTLLSFLLAENVAVDTEYQDERVRDCLEQIGFGQRLQELKPNGIRTYLYKNYTDEGVEISGGEAQKIAIARALYKDAPFVLLDEPTAALDPVAESAIYTHFDQMIGDKTAIYISHRLSSCKFCDKIVVFKEGQLAQCGSHEELVSDETGEYAKMWQKQAQYYSGF